MPLVQLLVLGLLCFAGAERSKFETSKEAVGVWDEGVDPEAYYDDEDFFAPKVPSAMPATRPAKVPAAKTFFLEKKVQLSQKGMENWMEARFADKSTVRQLASQGPTAGQPALHERPLREDKRSLSPAKDFRFRSMQTNGARQKVMPPMAGIGWNSPCPRFGISNIYYGQAAPGPNLYPDRPCYQFDYTNPYYAKPVHPLLPELEVGIQSPPVNFYSDGSRYPKNMEAFDHYPSQGADTSLTPNSATAMAAPGAPAAGGAPAPAPGK